MTSPTPASPRRQRNWEPANLSLPVGLKKQVTSLAKTRYRGTPYASLSGLVAGLLRAEKAHKRGLIADRAAMFA